MESKVLALLCDGRGAISKVLRDDFQSSSNITPDGSFMDLFDPANQSSVENFLAEIRANGSVLHRELFDPIWPQLEELHFSEAGMVKRSWWSCSVNET
jgi:hypothetical protein